MPRKPFQALALFISVLFAGPLGAASAGTGLWGQYYQDPAFSEYITGQLDPQVNFNWGSGTAPAPGVNDSTFGVRWSGQIEALCAGNYTFSTLSDDGVRLYINGSLVINNWTAHSVTPNAAPPVFIAAGATVSVVMEFFDNYGTAQAELHWQVPGCVPSDTLIPSSQLYPDVQAVPTPTFTPTPLPVWACPQSDGFFSGLGPQWGTTDIGAVVAGSQFMSANVVNVQADGSGVLTGPMFGEAASGDSARYIYQQVSGDFDVYLLVKNPPTTAGAQAGLMLREGLEEGARQASVFAVQGGSFNLSYRQVTGGGNSGAAGGTYVGPTYVRLKRTGNLINAYYSQSSPFTWIPVGTGITIASLSPSLYLGMAVSSDSAGTLSTGAVSDFGILSMGCTTATPTITATYSASPTFSFSPTASNTPTVTESFTDSPTFTFTSTVTPTPSITPTWTDSPTDTPTPTMTATPTITVTFSISPTWTSSPTSSPSPTISPTFTPGPGPPLSHVVAYPNPFSERLWIGFTLGAAASVEFVAFNVAGEEVYRQTQAYPQGTQLWPWDGVNIGGQRLASGIYLLRLKANGDVGWDSEWVTVALVR